MTTTKEKLARAIASANGDNFSDAFKNKTRWIAKRGMSGGRFRDVNEPYQSDYMDMATAALEALLEPSGVMVAAADELAGTINPIDAYVAAIQAALSEREVG